MTSDISHAAAMQLRKERRWHNCLLLFMVFGDECVDSWRPKTKKKPTCCYCVASRTQQDLRVAFMSRIWLWPGLKPDGLSNACCVIAAIYQLLAANWAFDIKTRALTINT